MRFEVTQIKSMIVNAYLLTGDRVALVDTLDGMGYGKIQRALRGRCLAVPDVEFILITHNHFDHAKNAARAKKLSGARLIAGLADAPVIEGTEPNPPPSELNRLGRFLGKLPEQGRLFGILLYKTQPFHGSCTRCDRQDRGVIVDC